MKTVEVIKRFKDKTINEFRAKENNNHIFDVTIERYEEIKDFVKIIDDEQIIPETKKEKSRRTKTDS